MTAPEAITAADDPLAPIARSLFQPLGVEGVYARTALYQDIMDRLGDFVSRERDQRAEVLRFPPVMSRRQLEKSGYLKSFPNLLGCVCALHGSEVAIRTAADRYESGGDWTNALGATDLVLSPAACYPLYPLIAGRGRIPAGGLIFDVAADCFRREPSRYSIDVANDPFFGRVGQIMAVSQIQQALKFELLIPYHAKAKPTACMSFNYHREHFGQVWGLQDSLDEPAHTGCVAFGMDRLVVALFANHGLDLARWPASTRQALAL